MRIYPVSQSSSISFKRQLTKAEEMDMQKITAQAKQVLGNTGNSVLVVHDACLPQAASRNVGVANILGEDSSNFFDFAKTYWGVNTVQMLPQGEFMKKGRSGMTCAYGYSALGLNDSLISVEALTQPRWKKILLPHEFEEIVVSNNKFDKATMVNFDNVNGVNSAFQKNLRKAFSRFMALDENEPLKQEFENFKTENADWLKPKGLYAILKKQNAGKDYYDWDSDLDRTLFDVDGNFSLAQRNERMMQIVSSDPAEAEFLNFRQFLAEKHLQEGRENLHKKGLKLFGDIPINFSDDEKWANPLAFRKDCYIGSNDWKASCLDYHSLTTETSVASKLLKRKFALAARRYDGIRVDAGWMYINPRMVNKQTKRVERLELGDKVLKMLEKEIAQEKGTEYNPEDIIYELKAGIDEFSMFEGGKLRPEVESRVVILESEYMNSGWGFNDHYRNVSGFKPQGYILGVGDHTSQPLAQIALGLPDGVEKMKSGVNTVRRDEHARVLSNVFGDSVETLLQPANFVRAKFADVMATKHNFVFYMDSLGRTSRFDAQWLNNRDNYRFKIVENYKDNYHLNVQKGLGLNLPDALSKAFEKAGLQEKHADIYKKLQEYAQILKEKDAQNLVESGSKISRGKLGYAICLLSCVSGALLLGSALFNKPKQEI